MVPVLMRRRLPERRTARRERRGPRVKNRGSNKRRRIVPLVEGVEMYTQMEMKYRIICKKTVVSVVIENKADNQAPPERNVENSKRALEEAMMRVV